MVDARIRHTRQLLAAAALDLAATTPIAAISVAALARRAGINRATFYDHYSSPGQLLAIALADEFDAMRAHYLELHETAPTPSAALTEGLHGLLDHVEQHHAIYRRALGTSPDPEVSKLFTTSFAAACLAVLQHVSTPPLPIDRARIIAAYAATGVIASIGAWLEDPELTREELIETLTATFPKWWTDQLPPNNP